MEITNLRCEYLDSPLGIDTQSPRFTWKYRGSDFATTIPVIELSTDSLFSHSKKIKAFSLFNAEAGSSIRLKPQKRYYWRVVARDGKTVVNSPVASFETGKLTQRD